MPSSDHFVTVKTAASIAGVCVRTIYTWLKNGKISPDDVRLTPGNKRRIRVRALLRRP